MAGGCRVRGQVLKAEWSMATIGQLMTLDPSIVAEDARIQEADG